MIARKSALILATQMANGLLGYIALFFITRYMSPEAYGVMAFAYSFVALFRIFGRMGFDQAHIKRVSEGKDLGTCIGTFLATKTGLIGLMSTLVVGAVFIWKLVIGRGFESPTHEMAIYIMLGYWVIHTFALSLTVTFKARKEIAKKQIPLFLETLIRAAVTIYVALAGYGAIALVLTYIAGDLVFLLSSIYLARRYPVSKPSHKYFHYYASFAIPIIVVVASRTIMTNVDKVLLQLFWSSADVGYYFSAFRLSRFIMMFATALGSLLFPTFSALHEKKDMLGIKRLTYQSERYISMMVFPMVFGIVTLAPAAVRILISGWKPAVPILYILPFFTLLAALERPYQSQQLGMNRPRLARNRVIIMVVLNVVLNIILIPRDIQSLGVNLAGLGAMGAAMATVIAYAAGLLYSRYVALRLTGAKGNPRILLHLLAAVIMSLSLHWLNGMFFIARWYHLLAFAALGLGIYLAVLFLVGEFTRGDLDFLLDTLNIKKMFHYIKEELMGK